MTILAVGRLFPPAHSPADRSPPERFCRFIVLLSLILACQRRELAERAPEDFSAQSDGKNGATVAAQRLELAALESRARGDASAPVTKHAACPDDMRSVEGKYCSRVQQICRRQQSNHEGHPTQSERCLEYQEPSICAGERQPLRFCIDRFEWPNRAGKIPRVLVSWSEASALCRGAGKRLCEEEEWTLACEGEQALPYTLGYSRPAQACAIDLPYRAPRARLLPHDECLEQTGCREELARLDQRRPAQEDSACVSPFGAVDMNGNVNEWVNASAARYPYRGALKGGWWGPVRNRCRPAVRRHREDHWGYEIGFRCCRNAVDTPSTLP